METQAETIRNHPLAAMLYGECRLGVSVYCGARWGSQPAKGKGLPFRPSWEHPLPTCLASATSYLLGSRPLLYCQQGMHICGCPCLRPAPPPHTLPSQARHAWLLPQASAATSACPAGSPRPARWAWGRPASTRWAGAGAGLSIGSDCGGPRGSAACRTAASSPASALHACGQGGVCSRRGPRAEARVDRKLRLLPARSISPAHCAPSRRRPP